MEKKSNLGKGRGERTITGVIQVTRSGKGFLIMPEGRDDIPIPRDRLGGALSGDIAEVRLSRGTRETIGTVLRVCERKRSSFVGRVEERGGKVLVPRDPRVRTIFALPGTTVEPGQMVSVDVTNWDTTPPEARVRTVLGIEGEHETEMRAILTDHAFRVDFPEDVTREAAALHITEDAIRQRRDMRDTHTFTIDPTTAKDFDDALSFKELGDGTIELGVHIADVSHFVRPGSPLDREAAQRATSIYLVDRTIPMLPPRLSEDLCSLVPNEDRLTMSAIFVMRGTQVVSRWFGRTVIRSTKRFTYDEADVVLEDPTHPMGATLRAIRAIADALRAERIAAGALIFDRTEVRPVLDAAMRVVGFSRTEATASHRLIEECMLLANREVATFARTALPSDMRVFMYRVHEGPSLDKLENLATLLRAIGYSLTLTSTGVSQTELGRMLRSVSGAPEEGLIQTATIRSMSRATYTTKNIGHYGLSFKDYAHFTSPIRRYPDVLVHRLLAQLIAGEPVTDDPKTIELLAVHASEREAEAAEAERESVKLKQAEFLWGKVGMVREGTISGVTEWGAYVEDRESGGEGMVHISRLPGFEHAPRQFALVNHASKERVRLGDRVAFTITAVDVRAGTIDCTLALEPQLPAQRAGRKHRE
ncbi:VacB/RNase II family 3'-5' exoribonuclease [Patescibacteria group bacterium]|nr:VacB/RNase II family 3'-5' exoribonuclease [Patescibacteria group bacterium]